MKTDFVKKYSHQIIAAVISFTLLISVLVMPVGAAGYANGWFTYDLESGSLTEANENAQAAALQAAQEGIVLLKNAGSALPFVKAEGAEEGAPIANVSVFGHNSVNPIYGGTGSADGSGENAVNLFEGLEKAGIAYNPVLVNFYNDSTVAHGRRTGGSMRVVSLGFQTGETALSEYAGYDPAAVGEKDYASLEESYADYSDAAIVVISRSGGEGYDLPTTSYSTITVNNRNPIEGVANGTYITGPVQGRTDPTEHYLELDDNEKDLLRHVTANFDKVIVVVNAANAMELGFVESGEFGDIDAALMIGFPGDKGFEALGQILAGEVNPSGRTVDSYAADFTADPTFANFAANNTYQYAGLPTSTDPAIAGIAGGAWGNAFINAADGTATSGTLVEYEEGIYMGYRYWETRGYTEGGTWYADHVVYPFGYGLSYTTFEKTVEWGDTVITKDGKVEIKVTVKNTGSVAGKETVSLYYSAPYTFGEIEKSHVVLGDFAKTDLLQPGESDTVTLVIKAKDMASYDWNDANGNGIYSYELEAGNYTLYVGGDSHVWADANAPKQVFTVAEDYEYALDDDKNDNRFTEVNEYIADGNMTVMSRTDFAGTFPKAPTVEERTKDAEFLSYLTPLTTAQKNENDVNQPWYVAPENMPTYRKSGETLPADAIMLIDLYGKSLDDPMWDAYLDQFTIEQYAYLVCNGSFHAGNIAELGIPQVVTPDGSTGIVPRGGNYRGVTYASYNILAGTFNVELMLKLGETWGEEGLWTNNGGIYAPATNTHRSPFAGRNFEYFSEDGVLAGKIVAPIVKGMQSKGMLPLTKHFGLNDQETNREMVTTWATEQAAREIYLKSFEYAVVEGGSMGIMSAYNNIGRTWAGAHYGLLTELLRGEWGFEGAVISDWGQTWMDEDEMIRGGGDYLLADGRQVDLSEEGLTATQVTALRNAAKHICNYVLNSNAMNQLNGAYGDLVNTELNIYIVNGNTWGNAYSTMLNEVSVSCPYYTMNYGNVSYVLDGTLPEGLTLNADGSFTQGSVSLWGGFLVLPAVLTPGSYTFGVVALIDGQNVGQRAEFTLNIIDTDPTANDVLGLVANQAEVIEQMLTKLGELNSADAALKAQLENELATLKALINAGNASVEELKAAVESANAAIDAAEAEIDSLVAANGELEDKIEDLEDEIEDLKEKLEALEQAQNAEPVEQPGFFESIWLAIVNFFKNLFGG
ncbi:MAG: glycoside hydrolase family 3 C-terminal domain-containing protein [Clostridia bacterium]|nr:glycoside hydrolase family 3 C-terminal domain-containing protein [Clostridia bacterium]